MINLNVKDFIEYLSADTSLTTSIRTSCILGALGASLGLMFTKLTLGRQEYLTYEPFFVEKNKKLEELHIKLTNKIFERIFDYSEVLSGLKLSKKKEDISTVRKSLQKTFKNKIGKHEEIFMLCYEVVEIISEIGTKGNKHALGDLVVGGMIASTGVKIASISIRRLLANIEDRDYVTKLQSKTQQLSVVVEEKVTEQIEEVLKISTR